MAQERSRHQQQIIRNYYKNRDALSLQKLQEQVTELYLADGKRRQQQWKRIAAHLEKLEVPAEHIGHLVEKDDPALVARLVEKLLAKQG